MNQIVIDPKFRDQLFPLSSNELGHLEQSIIDEGCREKLIVWNDGENKILVDGHNRYSICTANDIDFEVTEREFASRSEVEDWIDKNQAALRNCPPDEYSIITGRIYNRRKKDNGQRGEAKKLDQIEPAFQSTAQEVATELGVSAPTIKRNGQRAEVHDKILETGDKEAAEAARKVPQKVIQEARKQEPEQAAETVKKAVVHVSNNSGNQEWYTPVKYLELARKVLGTINLDPASNEVAQQNVKANDFYDADTDGLSKEWFGTVWLNPPYSAGMVDKFVAKLVEEYLEGNVTEAILLVNNATETKWFQHAIENASAVCFPTGRIKYLDATGKEANTPLQGQAFVYFGADRSSFDNQFDSIGTVLLTT